MIEQQKGTLTIDYATGRIDFVDSEGMTVLKIQTAAPIPNWRAAGLHILLPHSSFNCYNGKLNVGE